MSIVAELTATPDTLYILWSDGQRSRLMAEWLRDHCQMPECRNPANGQRLLNITDFPGDVVIDTAQILDENSIEIQFAPSHRSVFDPYWLYQNAYDLHGPFDNRGSSSKILWDGTNLSPGQLFFAWPDYLPSEEYKTRALATFNDYGFIVLTGVPEQSGAVLDVIDSFGYVRQTNYGRTFDVKTVVDPNNLAYTNLGLGLHTDNPYRDPLPTIQLLHCIENSVAGGESILVDGFRAAHMLRQESGEMFELLASTCVNFRFRDDSTDLHSHVPLIETNDSGDVIAVRFNNRSIAPVRVSPDLIKAFYAAYRRFAELIELEELRYTFRLEPGHLVLFDNARILHARKEFSAAGSRWLQGAYADLDSLYSTLSVLKNNSPGQESQNG